MTRVTLRSGCLVLSLGVDRVSFLLELPWHLALCPGCCTRASPSLTGREGPHSTGDWLMDRGLGVSSPSTASSGRKGSLAAAWGLREGHGAARLSPPSTALGLAEFLWRLSTSACALRPQHSGPVGAAAGSRSGSRSSHVQTVAPDSQQLPWSPPLADWLPHLTWESTPFQGCLWGLVLSLLSDPLWVLALVLQLLGCCPQPPSPPPPPVLRNTGAILTHSACTPWPGAQWGPRQQRDGTPTGGLPLSALGPLLQPQWEGPGAPLHGPWARGLAGARRPQVGQVALGPANGFLCFSFQAERPALNVVIFPLLHEGLTDVIRDVPMVHLDEITLFKSRVAEEPPNLWW